MPLNKRTTIQGSGLAAYEVRKVSREKEKHLKDNGYPFPRT